MMIDDESKKVIFSTFGVFLVERANVESIGSVDLIGIIYDDGDDEYDAGGGEFGDDD